MKGRTECAPDKLTMGASKLLVRWTVRIRLLLRSSLDDEMAIWFVGGGVARAFFTSAPAGGVALRFDMQIGVSNVQGCRALLDQTKPNNEETKISYITNHPVTLH